MASEGWTQALGAVAGAVPALFREAALPSGGTANIQIGLWAMLALAALFGAWELWHQRRRSPRRAEGARTGAAALISLPGGEIPPGHRHLLDGQELLIGRAVEADLRLADRSVAPRHAAVVPEEGHYWLKDLGSPTGVRVNGLRIERSALLRDGDLVEIAEQPFRFQQERPRAWRPNVWTAILLLVATLLFLQMQWSAWSVAGAGRPAAGALWLCSGGLAAGAWLATGFVRWRKGALDPLLLPTALVLLGLGLAILLRIRPELYLRQAQAGALGLGLLALAAILPLDRIGRYRYLSLVTGLGLLVATLLFGNEVGGQRLSVRLFGLQFQPAEPAKLLLAIFLAGLLSERQELVARSGRSWTLTRSDVRYAGPMILALGVALGLLIVQRDLGSALLFFALFVAFLGMASGRAIFVLVSLGAFAFGAVLSAAAFDRVRDRIALWLHPWHDPQGLGYQLTQGLFALAAGGLEGVGLGRGFPFLIPAAHTDLPMAVLGEELGLLGSLGVLALLGLLVLRGYRAALRADDDFLGLLAAGLSTVLALQTVVIVGGLVRLLPLTGVTLPFISFGGTSLVINLALVGVLLGVSAAEALPQPGSRRRRVSRFSWRRQLGWVMAFVGAGFAALGAGLWHWQVRESTRLALHPSNPRLLLIAPQIRRGKILSVEGKIIADSVYKDGRFRRLLPDGSLLAPIVGYASQRHGKTGVEGEADAVLLGARAFRSIAGALERAEQRLPGDTVRLTIHLGLQKKAAALLGDRHGSIVALDPRTGAIRAMVSRPGYSLHRIDERWEQLVRDPRKPLLFPATQGVYPPGSTFKVVTAAVALDSGVVRPDSRFYCPSAGRVGNYVWHCFHGKAHGRLTFADALRVSCNVTFGKVGLALGRQRLEAGARQLGIGVAPPLTVETGRGLLNPYGETWPSVPAQIGFGQGPLAVTPLQMALVAAAIANDGVLMKPRLIEAYETPEGAVYARNRPEAWRRAISAKAARQVRQMMVAVVERGTGQRARLPGLSIAGKTGTAENPHGHDHAWFIAMAPAQQPKLVVAVLVEGAGQGGRVAAPIARQLFASYFGLSDRESSGRP